MAECRPFTHAGQVLHLRPPWTGCCAHGCGCICLSVCSVRGGGLLGPLGILWLSLRETVSVPTADTLLHGPASELASPPLRACVVQPRHPYEVVDCHSLVTPRGERASVPLLATCVFEMSVESLPAVTGLPSCSCSVRILRIFCKLDSSDTRCAHIFFHSSAVFSLP